MVNLLSEADAGVIEAARSMGASNLRIIVKVFVEAETDQRTLDCSRNHLSYSAMAGTIGGGVQEISRSDMAITGIRADIMIVTVVLLVILVQIFQMVGTTLANRLDKRR